MILAFDAWAVMGTWGIPSLLSSNGGARETQLHPGKAAVCGIVGAALGSPKEDAHILASRLRVACRTDASPTRQPYDYESIRRISQSDSGVPMSRFQERQAFDRLHYGSPTGSIIHSREYWSNGGWTVFIHGDDILLDQVRKGMQSPFYATYAGRRCFPFCAPHSPHLLDTPELAQAVTLARPLHARVRDECEAMADALAAWRLQSAGYLYWEEGFPAGMQAMARRPVRQCPLQSHNLPEKQHPMRLFGEHVECSAPSPRQ